MYNTDTKRWYGVPVRTTSERGDVQLIVETEYGFEYDGVEYATYSEAEAAKAEKR